MNRIVFPVALLLLAGSMPSASALTAGELLAQCEQLDRSWVISGGNIELRQVEGGDKFDAVKCLAYFHAYFDIAQVRVLNPEHPSAPPTNPLNTCPPNSVSLTQVIRMFLRHARSNPGELHHAAFFMVQNMLVKNFPCENLHRPSG